MRKTLSALLVLAVGAVFVPAAPDALAADLGASPAKKVGHYGHKRLHVVRDYDGTPVAVYRIRQPQVVIGPYWAAMPVGEFYHVPLIRPQPRIYFNGEPVMSRLAIRNYY